LNHVGHNILLAKLKFYGISGNNYALYESYLENRYQRTAPCNDKEAHNKVSSWVEVLHDVPQVSVVGPVLFLIYTNDPSKIINDKSVPILCTGTPIF
jgi:hypothetical protein